MYTLRILSLLSNPTFYSPLRPLFDSSNTWVWSPNRRWVGSAEGSPTVGGAGITVRKKERGKKVKESTICAIHAIHAIHTVSSDPNPTEGADRGRADDRGERGKGTIDALLAVTLTLMEVCLPLTCISKRRHEKNCLTQFGVKLLTDKRFTTNAKSPLSTHACLFGETFVKNPNKRSSATSESPPPTSLRWRC